MTDECTSAVAAAVPAPAAPRTRDSDWSPVASAASGRIPSLDGLRGACISAVVLGHLEGTAGFPFRGIPFVWGKLGVGTFFVVSGYLITTLLLKERARTGRVSLRAFYVRRVLRLFPALYVFAAVVALLDLLGIVELQRGDVLAAATHTMNFHAQREWWLGHTWSLSFQEQFYALWPAAIAFLGVAGGLRVATAALVAAPVVRVGVFYLWPSQRALVDQAFPMILDGPATGCLLAILRDRLWQDARYRALLGSSLFVAVPVVVALTFLYTPRVGVSLLLGQTVVNVGIALCIDSVTRFPRSPIGVVLNSRAVTWVGTISYSLYLWQQLFLCRAHVRWYTTFPVNIVLAVAAGALSYYAIELPMQRRRARVG